MGSRIIIILCLLTTSFAMNGCSSPEVKEEVVPSVSDLPDIEAGLLHDDNWTSKAVCWVGQRDKIQSSWKIEYTPTMTNRRSKKEIVDFLETQIREALIQDGLTVNSFGNEMYLTRQERLSVEVQIFVKGFSLEQIKVKEGYCYDAKIILDIVSYPDSENMIECIVPGRIIVAEGQKQPLENIRKRCLENITHVAEFRQACVRQSEAL